MNIKSKYVVFLICFILGGPLGTGLYVAYYSKALSYLSNDSQSCKNCHAMNPQYESWQKSSHHGFTNCNSCHASGNFFQKYYTKALNGFSHSYKFTVGNYPEVIQIKDSNRKVAERSCRECHSQFIESSHALEINQLSCLQCHKDVGHLGNK